MRKTLTTLMAVLLVGSVLGGAFVGSVAAVDSEESSIEISDQALTDNDEVYVTYDVQADGDTESDVVPVLTYEDADGDTTVAGIGETVTDVSETEVQSESDSIEVEEADAAPGELTAHLFNDGDFSTAVGDSVDAPADVTDTGVAMDVTFNGVDAEDGELDEVTVENVNVDAGGADVLFAVEAHPANDDGEVDSSETIGTSGEYLDSTDDGVTVSLDENMETDESVFVMLHAESTSEADAGNDYEAGDMGAVLTYDADAGELNAGATTLEDEISETVDTGEEGNDLPVIGDLPLLGGLSVLQLGLVALVLVLLVGGGYWYTEEYEANLDYEYR